MSVNVKKCMLINYFRTNGGIPSGSLNFDTDSADIGNVYIDGNYYGTFDWHENKFIHLY